MRKLIKAKELFLWVVIMGVFVLYSTARGGIVKDMLEENTDISEVLSNDTLVLYVGDIQSIPVSIPISVAIGNPEIADIIYVKKSEIRIVAKNPGVTKLKWKDNLGSKLLKIRVYKENMREVKKRVDSLLRDLNLPRVYTRASDEEAKVFILGEVKDENDIERINKILSTLADKVTNLVKVEEDRSTIEIDVEVLEIEKDSTRNLGFTLPSTLSLGETAATIFGGSGYAEGRPARALFNVLDFSRTALEGKLDLLIREGKARILSRPKLACQSGKEAELLVGGEEPVLTTSVVGGSDNNSTNVEYKEYGIKLKIRPRLEKADKIRLSLEVEVSDLGNVRTLGAVTNTTAMAYSLTKRNTSTELFLDNEQTLAISGLMRHKTEEELRRFPWLADVPILGAFFRGRTAKTGGGSGSLGDTELVILLTPRIVNRDENYAPSTIMINRGANNSGAQLDYYAKRVARLIKTLLKPLNLGDIHIKKEIICSLHINSQGELLNVYIKKSSGIPKLDTYLLHQIKKVKQWPSFPARITDEAIWIDIPVIYSNG